MTAVVRQRGSGRKPLMVMRGGRLVRSNPVAAQPGEADQDQPAAASPAPAVREHAAVSYKVGIALFIISLCIPLEGEIMGLRLMPSTAYLLFGLIPAGIVCLTKRERPLNATDWLVIAFWGWATLAVIVNQGPGTAIEPSGMHLIQTVGAYLTGRALIHNPATMRFMAKVALGIMIFTLPLAVIEAVTRKNIVLDLAAMVGPSYPQLLGMGMRMGLTRAQAYFSHPILFGVFCASLFCLIGYGLTRTNVVLRWIGATIAALCAMTSLSTGALLALNAQLGLMAWRRIFRNNPARWQILGSTLLITYVALDMFTQRTPFHTFVRYATFSAASSYNRILIWEFGSAEVMRHPLFGIGFGDWERAGFMGNSVDNFWLLNAMRYGLPGVALLVAAFVVTLIRMMRASGRSAEIDSMRRALGFSLAATMIAIFSVHLWNATYMWLMFMLGAAVWMTHPAESGSSEPDGKTAIPRSRRRSRGARGAA